MRLRALVLLMTLSHSAHGQHHAGHDHHGNPDDLEGYIAKLEDPARDAWQLPDKVVAALALQPGATACDIGAGPGYFALRMARAVGARGQVFAVDVEPRILDVLRQRIAKSTLRNVTPVLALGDDPLLPPASCDLILIVDTFHHFPDGAAYLKRLTAALRPGGQIVNIDFQKRELPVGPPVEHKVAREDFIALAQRAGLQVVNEPTFLPHQYFLMLRPKK